MDPRKLDDAYKRAINGYFKAILQVEHAIRTRHISLEFIDEQLDISLQLIDEENENQEATTKERQLRIGRYFKALYLLREYIYQQKGKDYDCDFLNAIDYNFIERVLFEFRSLSISGTKTNPAVPIINRERPSTLRDLAKDQLRHLDLGISKNKKINILNAYHIIVGVRDESMPDAAKRLLSFLDNDPKASEAMLGLILQDPLLFKEGQKEQLLSEMVSGCEQRQSRSLLKSLRKIISTQEKYPTYPKETAKKWLLAVVLNVTSHWHQALISADHLSVFDKLEICDWLRENDEIILSLIAELAKIKRKNVDEDEVDEDETKDNNKSDLSLSSQTYIECSEGRRKQIDALKISLLATLLKIIETIEKLTNQNAFMREYAGYPVVDNIIEILKDNKDKPLPERYKKLVKYAKDALNLRSYPDYEYVYPTHLRELLFAINNFDTQKLSLLEDKFVPANTSAHSKQDGRAVRSPKIKFD